MHDRPAQQFSILRAALVVLGLAAVAACSGGTKTTPAPVPTFSPHPSASPSASPSPSPTPTPTATPTAVPAAVTSVVTLSIAAAGPAVSAAPLPAPTGYTSRITIPLVSAPAGTTVSVTSSTRLPASLPVLQSIGRTTMSRSVRVPQAASDFTPIFFDAIVPSQNITVAGAVDVFQGFPAGVLSSTGQYYVAYFDSTAPSPAWQTIAGPITPATDGQTLEIKGTVGSTTLLQNQLYGFAIFSVATGSTATPPPVAQTIAYIPQSNGSILLSNVSGTGQSTLNINSTDLGLDDSGNIYSLKLAPTPAPVASGATPTPVTAPFIAMYPAGSATAKTVYTPSNPNGVFLLSSGSGAFLSLSSTNNFTGGVNTETFDVWNPGATGSPSFTLTEPSGPIFFGIMGHDGTIYAPHQNTDGSFQYDVYNPQSSTVSRTIPETIGTTTQYGSFSPNYSAVGSDGTLYVTEYTFAQPDTQAGLYIYPKNGTEKFVATTSDANGAGPQGVDVDASGNIYVVNNNAAGYCYVSMLQPCQGDSLKEIEVFGPLGVGGPNGAASPLHIPIGGSAYPITAAPDGTIFYSQFDGFSGAFPVTQGTYGIAAGTKISTQLAPLGTTLIVLYDGSRETQNTRRTASMQAAGSGGHSLGGPIFHHAEIMRRLAALPHR